MRFININVCGRDAYKQGALPLLADAREALQALAGAAQEAGIETEPSYRREVVEICRDWEGVCRREVDEHEGDVMLQTQLVRTLQEESRPGDTVIAAAGSPPGDILKFWDATGARHCHLEFGYSCMGYEMPAGLGVRMADSGGEVVVFIGDGTYLMNPTELVTAVQEGLKLTVVISENRGYQCIRGLQELRSGQAFGNEFRRRNSETGRLDGGLPGDRLRRQRGVHGGQDLQRGDEGGTAASSSTGPAGDWDLCHRGPDRPGCNVAPLKPFLGLHGG